MAATTDQLNALAQDGIFIQRCRNIVLQAAASVYNESAGTANHAARAAFAVKLLQTPTLADLLVPVIVTRTNVVASTVTYDFANRRVVSDVSDAALLSQIQTTDWNMLAGV